MSESARRLPLLGHRDPDAPLAWRSGRPVSARGYLADVQRQASALPQQGPAVNLCTDRYLFAVGLGAALLRGQPSLLPPDARPETLAHVCQAHAGAFALADPAGPAPDAAGLRRVPVVADGSSLQTGMAMPMIDGGQHAVSLLTSGSTGLPQPHAKRWETLVGDVHAALPQLCALLGRPSLAGLTLVATVPAQHSFGLESTVLLAMLGGAAFESGRPFYPADIVQALESVPQPRALVTTPFHLKTLLHAGLALPAVSLVLSATAPLSPQLAAQAEQAMGAVLVEIYGSTESGQIALRRTTQGETWETFGRIEVHARPDEDGGERFIASGDFIPGPTPMADVLELLDSRHFRLLGRSNDLIHVAGRRSSLGHLNYHLNSIPGVQDGAFWLPDEVADGVVRTVAFVVAPGLSPQAIVAALRERVEPVFLPRKVMHVASLPRHETGKLGLRALREFALAHRALEEEPGGLRAVYRVPEDHPCFAGHFPGQPLLPGALLLAQLQEAAAAIPALHARLGDAPAVAAAKFLAPVRPGATAVFEFHPEEGAGRGVRFEARIGDTVAVSGRWSPGPAAA